MNEKGYIRLCRILSVNSIFSLVAVFISAFLASSGTALCFIAVCAAYALMCIGYFTVGLCSKIFGFKRINDDKGYEATVKYFTPSRGIFGIILALAASGIVYALSAKNTVRGSLLPLLLATLTSVPIIVGTVVWFYPDHRLVSIKTLLVSAPLFFAAMILIAINSSGMGTGFIVPAICLASFAISTLIMLNQINMQKSYMGTVVSYATLSDKRYNINTVLILIAFMLISSLFIYTILNGLRVIFLLCVAMLFMRNGGINNPSGNMSPEEISTEINILLFDNEKASNSVNFYAFIFFILLVIVFAAYMLIRKHTSGLRLLELFKRMIDGIIGFFYHIFNRIDTLTEPQKPTISNYIDEHTTADVEGSRGFSIEKDTFEDFMRRLDRIGDSKKRLEFSYRTFVSLLHNTSVRIKRSDTPRQIAEKIAKADESFSAIVGSYSIEEITKVFETAAYAKNDLGASRNERATEMLVSMIRRIMV